MRKIAAFALLVALCVGPSTVAASTPPRLYVLKHPHRGHCRAHYRRRARVVRLRHHGHILHRRQTICVRIKPAAALPATPVQSAIPTSVTQSIRLHAHLDPSFVQDPHNPLAVVYSYSASATSEASAPTLQAIEPAPLPAGVLELYSDGRLACAINVGETIDAGTCPVTYSALGAHAVTTTYISGTTTATESSTEQVEPFATTTTLTVTPLGCGEEEHLFSEPKPFTSYHSVDEWCSYAVNASVLDQDGNPAPSNARVEVSASPNVTLERPGGFGQAATLALERETSSDAEASARPGKAAVWRCRVVTAAPPTWPERQSEYNDGWGFGNGSTEQCGAAVKIKAVYHAPTPAWRDSESSPAEAVF